MLRVISREVEDSFFDASLRGLDWSSLTSQAGQQIEASGSAGEMFLALFRLVNQLKDSHTVFVPPGRAVHYAFGFDARAFADEVLVYELQPEGAAASAGLQLGDRLLNINGFNADRRSLEQMMLFFRLVQPAVAMEVVFSRDGGPPQTVLIEGRKRREALVSDLTRVETLYELIRDAESAQEEFRYRTDENSLGYLHLPSFSGDKHFLKRLTKKVKGARSLVIDLRGNPGGAIKTLEAFMGFFETEKTEVATLVGREKSVPLEIRPQEQAHSGPLVILVDSTTASAAEIFAYHFQQTGRATIVGDATAGRVTAALLHQYSVGVDAVVSYSLQVATARVVFPGGVELEGRGVSPDQPCLPSADDLRRHRDPCLDQAEALARSGSLEASETPWSQSHS